MHIFPSHPAARHCRNSDHPNHHHHRHHHHHHHHYRSTRHIPHYRANTQTLPRRDHTSHTRTSTERHQIHHVGHTFNFPAPHTSSTWRERPRPNKPGFTPPPTPPKPGNSWRMNLRSEALNTGSRAVKEVAEPTPATKTNIGTGHDERKWENKRIEAYSPPNVYLIPSAHSVAGPDTPASNPLDNNEKERDRDLEFKVAAAREKVREARRMLMPPRSAAVDKSKEGNRDEIPKKRWADVDKDFEGFFKEKMKDNDGGLQKAMDDEQQHEEWAKRFKLWE